MPATIESVDRELRGVVRTLEQLTAPIRATQQFVNQAGFRLLQSGIVGPLGVALGNVLVDLTSAVGEPPAGSSVSQEIATIRGPGELTLPDVEPVTTLLPAPLGSASFNTPPPTTTVETILGAANQLATLTTYQNGYYAAENPLFSWHDLDGPLAWANLRNVGSPGYPTPPRAVDWTDWDGSEYVWAFLNRVLDEYYWFSVEAGGEANCQFAKAYDGTAETGYWLCHVPYYLLPLISGQLWGKLKQVKQGPPAWPGLADVTFGTPVALSSDLTIPGPMDGLILAVTTPPTGLGKFAIGGQTAYYSLGQVAFVSDNGDIEPWQFLSWDVALYTARHQVRAATALVRVLAGAQGTATPWTVT